MRILQSGDVTAVGAFWPWRQSLRWGILAGATLLLQACSGSGSGTVTVQDGGVGGAGGACKPQTCAAAQAKCGSAPDGCGSAIECGVCGKGLICGGAGPNQCGTSPCPPKTCATAGAECGAPSDGCGAVLACGSCAPNSMCSPLFKCVSSGAGGSGGSGGAGNPGGSGGSGGTTCSTADYCGKYGLTAGWHCDGQSAAYQCGIVGGCPHVTNQETCASGCQAGMCDDSCPPTCSGHCGSYFGCDCGECTGGNVCTNNVCVPSCTQTCAGHCGDYSGCSCGDCTGSDVCVAGTCQGCANGTTKTQACTVSAECPPGESVSTCSNGSWGPYGQCASPFRYYGDGVKHCGTTGVTHLCLETSSAGNDSTVQVTISKEDASVFTNDIRVVLTSGLGPTVDLGCVASQNQPSYVTTVNGSSLGLFLGEATGLTASIYSPCADTMERLTGTAGVKMCKP